MDDRQLPPSSAAPPISPRDASDFVRQLAELDAPCPSCGYMLRGVTTSHCPECGSLVTLRRLLDAAKQPIGAWAAMVMSLVVSAPHSFAKWHTLLRWGRLDYGSFNASERWSTVVGGASHVYWLGVLPLLIILLVWRDAYRRLPRRAQWWVAGIAIAMAVLANRRIYGASLWW